VNKLVHFAEYLQNETQNLDIELPSDSGDLKIRKNVFEEVYDEFDNLFHEEVLYDDIDLR
jgi:hypothetical protein